MDTSVIKDKKNSERRWRGRGFPFNFRPLQNREQGVGGGGRVGNGMTAYLRKYGGIDRFQSRGQQLCKLLGIKESFNMWKEFNSHRIFFVHKDGRRFIVFCTNMAAVTSCENDLYSCSIILWKLFSDVPSFWAEIGHFSNSMGDI